MGHDLWNAAQAVASSPAATAIAKANGWRDTQPERALRSILHARGLRYRTTRTIPLVPEPGRRRRWTRPDLVFAAERVEALVRARRPTAPRA